MKSRLFVCETCGTQWDMPLPEEPMRDNHGRVICTDCYEDPERID